MGFSSQSRASAKVTAGGGTQFNISSAIQGLSMFLAFLVRQVNKALQDQGLLSRSALTVEHRKCAGLDQKS